jgi:beta-glucoside operon transcriptional antiterminator
MRVQKVLNNNLVSSTNDRNEEVIILGRGIGFQKKVGDLINAHLVEKIFVLNEPHVLSKLEKLIKDIPEKYLAISDEIIQYARDEFDLYLRESLYLTLMDHIYLAVDRIKKGIIISNVMLSDVKCFYKNEYEIGLKALEIINRELDIMLPDDEAGFIALHVIDASLHQTGTNNIESMRLSHDILDIVKEFYNIEIDEQSMRYFRFANHVNYLAKRLLSHAEDTESDDIIYKTARINFPQEYLCVKTIKKHILEKYGISIPQEELGYLMVNLRALLKNKNY